MTAFINGAISALNRVLYLIKILDPEETDETLIIMKNQILTYIEMYKDLQRKTLENPIKDETWRNIEKTSLKEEDEENVEKILYDA